MVRCPTEPDLERFVLGRCSPAESASIGSHESGCGDCAAWLSEAREGESVLADLRRAVSFTEAGELAGEPPGEQEEPALARYRILRRIGEGGMGIVYEAEQRNPRRPVALKVLASALLSRRALERFEREAQVLGRLVHPGIGQILEAGTYDARGETRPFFAMELVDGEPLTDYADAHALDVRARVRLLCRVADAVQHAHQRGVLHRDLKPGNILVTASGQPKILDFGVARVFDPQAGALGARPGAVEIAGTLRYMSPEQLGGDPLEVDTRSDVYALGVLLFELLTGRLPLRIDPPTLEQARSVAEHQQPVLLGTIDPRLGGDLERIAAMALAQDREARYESVSAFASDLRHFLGHQPIAARPASRAYHMRLFVRRNRGLVAGLALAFLMLSAGIVTTAWQARVARAARAQALAAQQIAQLRAATVEQANQFMQALIGFDDDDPAGVVRSGETTLREVMADSETLFSAHPFDDPGTEAAIRVAIGNAQRRFGLVQEAVATLERALELRLAEQGPDGRGVAECLNTLGVAQYMARRPEQAIASWGHALKIYGRLDARVPELEATARGNLASALTAAGDLEEAESMLLEALAVHEQSLGTTNLHVASDLEHLASLRLYQRRPEEALELLERAQSIAIEIGQEDHPHSLVQQTRQVTVLLALRHFDRAEALARELAQRFLRIEGAQSSRTADAFQNHAFLLFVLGRSEQARAPIARSVELYRSLPEPGSPLAQALHIQARILLACGDASGAESPARESVDLYIRVLGPQHPDSRAGKLEVALALLSMGRTAEAEELLREVVDRQYARNTGRRATARALSELAQLVYRRDPEASEVEPLHRAASAQAELLTADSFDQTRAAVLGNHGRFLLAAGRDREARERFTAALTSIIEDCPGHAELRAELEQLLAECGEG